MQVNAKNQRDWADQQIREKKAEKQREKDEEMGYAHQQDAINRMINMLEAEAGDKRAQMAKQMQEENKQAALAKKQRENEWAKE